MAFTFIGKSPDPLPLPSGLELDSRRFAGITAPPPAQRPSAPTKLRVRYKVTKADGRIKDEITVLDPLPEQCTVRDLQMLMHEHMGLSPRHPIELRFWGQKLELLGTGVAGQDHVDRPLAFYAIKDHSELTVVVKPLQPLSQVRRDGPVTRLRVMSHKLGAGIPLDGLLPEHRIGDLKLMLKAYLQRSPIFLVKGQAPPGTPAPPPVVFTLADFTTDAGGGGGGKGKGAGGMLRRVSDGMVGTLAEPDLWELKLEPEQNPSLQFCGFPLPDDSLISSHSLVNNEIIYLNFAAPWEPDDPVGKGGGGGDKGGKKKK
jgi:hypothetical protein